MNGGSSKSLLPLVEILISIGIFAIAVVLTLQLFLLASFLGHKTSDTAKAIFEVQNVAENIKTMKTDDEMTDYIQNELNGFSVDANFHPIYYNEEWERVDNIDEAAYNLNVIYEIDDTYSSGNLYKFKIEMYKTEPYPFIDDKKIEKDKDYIPVLVSINANKFIAN